LLVVRSRRPEVVASPRSQSTGEVAGTVLDARTAMPLPGVVVAIPALYRETVSDSNGRFVLAEVPAGSVALHVSLVGYGLAAGRRGAPARALSPPPAGPGPSTEWVRGVGDPFRGTSSSVAVQQALSSAEI